MLDLLNWFKTQPGGVGSYEQFCDRALELTSQHPEHAAALRLLANIAGKFADAYSDQPLHAFVADAAFEQMVKIIELIKASMDGSAHEQLQTLNAVAVQNLD